MNPWRPDLLDEGRQTTPPPPACQPVVENTGLRRPIFHLTPCHAILPKLQYKLYFILHKHNTVSARYFLFFLNSYCSGLYVMVGECLSLSYKTWMRLSKWSWYHKECWTSLRNPNAYQPVCIGATDNLIDIFIKSLWKQIATFQQMYGASLPHRLH